MVSSLEHVDACVPVTALKALPWGQQNFILQGQGPWMRVVNDDSGEVMTQIQVFKRNNVHGFIPLSQGVDEQARPFAQILIWGGPSLRVVDLTSNSSDGVISSLSSSEFLAPDWIMSGCAAVKDQPVAAYLVTANNALLSLTLRPNQSSRYQTSLEIHQLATSVKSILCAADLIALSPTHVLIAAGTIFGEIIVWSCFTDVIQGSKTGATGSIHHFFTGHDGTVFGVRISPILKSLRHGGQPGRLLASCSDDRTLRLWDISDCEHKSVLDPSSYSTDGYGLRSTGFGSTSGDDKDTTSEGCIAKAFGHSARIWSILFRSMVSSDSSRIGLVTRGEDATCVAWNLSWSTSDSGPTKYELSQQSSTHAHFGKHIWSMDLRGSGEETVIYTGGADGALRSFRVNETRISAPDIPPINTQHQPKNTSIAHFAFVDSDYLIACDNQNSLQIGLAQPDNTSSVSWEPISGAGEFGLINKIRGIPDEGLALISNGQGQVRLYNHSIKSVSDLADLPGRPMNLFFLPVPSGTETSNPTIFFLASYANDDIATLVRVEDWNKDSRQAHLIQITLPRSPFAISSALMVNGGEYLLLGSKLGGLSIHPVQNANVPTDALFVDRRVHGHDGTNDIQKLSSAQAEDGSNLEYILTCGRDGRICVHEIQIGIDPVDPPKFRTVHRSESGLAGNIEGAYLEEHTGDLIVYGFRSQNFVLYNESKQLDIISVNSGGARRAWAFHPRSHGAGPGIIFWRDKAGLKSCVIEDNNNRLIRAGVHGREVKAADAIEAIGPAPPLYVTGAEDTLVRIFSSPQTNTVTPWGHFHTLRSLNTHRSGVQHVSWSKTGKFLFTSAAEEEFFVWRIRWIPSFGLATHLVASAPRDPDSELRITSFDMVEVEESTGDCGFLLCLTFSNSVVKIFHYSPDSENSFSLLAQGRYMENCLTQSSFLVEESSVTLLTAATDGYLTVWDLTTTLEPFYTISSSIVKREDTMPGSGSAPEDIVCEDRYQIHSNSIKAMEIVSISSTITAILSGSDDNSISISLLTRSQTSTSEPQIEVSTTLVPDAHAASVTAIKTLNEPRPLEAADCGTVKIIFASSGNDHQVKIWALTLDSAEAKSPGINLQLLRDRYSSVADISSFTLVRKPFSQGEVESKMAELSLSTECEVQLLVCGVGIEILKLNV